MFYWGEICTSEKSILFTFSNRRYSTQPPVMCKKKRQYKQNIGTADSVLHQKAEFFPPRSKTKIPQINASNSQTQILSANYRYPVVKPVATNQRIGNCQGKLTPQSKTMLFSEMEAANACQYDMSSYVRSVTGSRTFCSQLKSCVFLFTYLVLSFLLNEEKMDMLQFNRSVLYNSALQSLWSFFNLWGVF